MRVFLTGGTGFIGQALMRALAARGWTVRALVRDPGSASAQWLQQAGATLVPGDVTQVEGLLPALAHSDLVLHAAGVHEIGADAPTAERMRQVNIVGTQNVLGAALAARIPRTLYVSSAWALGDSGPGPADEDHRHDGRHFSACDRSKFQAHQVALRLRNQGLKLVIAMPNSVVGANDHSLLGYLLRLYLLRRMPPVAFGAEAVLAPVAVEALAEGLCLAGQKARVGQDYLFCGSPCSIRGMFDHWARHPGSMVPKVWLAQAAVRPQMGLMEGLLRRAGLPAFLSREVVDLTQASLNYGAAKARHDLGWKHPEPGPMWDRIVAQELERMAGRRGFLDQLRHQAVWP
jgi:nucleoside-diphosphate-sugar epimerase